METSLANFNRHRVRRGQRDEYGPGLCAAGGVGADVEGYPVNLSRGTRSAGIRQPVINDGA